MSTRSELRENALAARLEVAIEWIIENRPAVLAGIVFAIGAVLIGSVISIRRREEAERNWTRLAQAQALTEQKMTAQAASILDEVRKSAGGEIQLYATFYRGDVALAQGDAEAAISSFSEVAERSGNSPLKPLALSNLAQAQETKKDFNAAAQTYQKFMERYSDHFLASRVQLGLGRSLVLAGRADEGRKALEQLVDLYPTSEWAEMARAFMDKNKIR